MTIAQTFTRNFVLDVTSTSLVEIYRPGALPAPANAEVRMGRINLLMGFTDIVLPPTQVGGTWSGISVGFFLRVGTGSAARIPIFTWDIAANGVGQQVDLSYQITADASRDPLAFDTLSSLFAQLLPLPTGIPAGKKIWLYGVAVESNQYG